MKFRELLNTNQNVFDEIDIWFDEDSWADDAPEIVMHSLSDLGSAEERREILFRYVDAWVVKNNVLEVLLSER